MSDQDFNRGYIIACCNMINLHDDPVIAWDTLSQLGITRKEVKELGLSDYDLKALRKIERDGFSESPYADGRKVRRSRKQADKS